MTTILEAPAAALDEVKLVHTRTHVVVCLFGMTEHVNGQPQFGCKVYGPFTEDEAVAKQGEIRLIEGGAVLVRPMVDLEDTYRRMSAD
jgi:hypothetical protein